MRLSDDDEHANHISSSEYHTNCVACHKELAHMLEYNGPTCMILKFMVSHNSEKLTTQQIQFQPITPSQQFGVYDE